GLSVTGSNADLRVAVAPSELGSTAVALLAAVARRTPKAAFHAELPALPASTHDVEIDRIADLLVRHRGEALVVSGSDDLATPIGVKALNVLLDGIGATVDLDRPSLQRQGDDAAMAALIDDMQRGGVGVLIVWGANPVH